MSQVGVVLVSKGYQYIIVTVIFCHINEGASLFWQAFSAYPQIHWVKPIITSIAFGAAVLFIFMSVFTYLVNPLQSRPW
jgi:hypothetical protein